jgi:hypothetical protein
MSSDDSQDPPSSYVEFLVEDDWPGRSELAVIGTIQTGFVDKRFSLSFWATLYFYVTVTNIFGPNLADTIKSLQHYNSEDAACIDRLTEARNMISVSGEVAWQLISLFRGARGLPTLKQPKNLVNIGDEEAATG